MGTELMKMMRYTVTTLLGLAAATVSIVPLSAAEATMRLRGSDQTFTGELVEFDGKSYLIENELFGKVYLDAARFECISGACFNPSRATASVKAPQDEVTVAPSADTQKQPAITQEERNQLFKEFLEWNERNNN